MEKSLLIKDTTLKYDFVVSSSNTIYKCNIIIENMVKLFYVIILCVLLPTKLMATAQQGDKIFINGKMHEMLTCPIEADSIIQNVVQIIKPAGIVTNTSLWRGYVGYWSIKNSTLYLDSLQFETENIDGDYVMETVIPNDGSAFSAYKDNIGIKASWFSGELRVIQGKLLKYVHMGFESTFKKELFLTVKEGAVIHSRKVKNKAICKNMLDRSTLKAFNDAFIKEFPDTKAVNAIVSYSKVNAKGQPTDVEINTKDITENKEKIYNFIHSYLLRNHILGVYKINNKLIFEKSYIRLGNKWINTSNL